ncbi:MAG: M24 family metallopeptidase, partial [Hyphomicrobiales bacterium]
TGSAKPSRPRGIAHPTTSQTVLDEGMVFSIEPGIYLQGQFGLRLEEIVIIRNGKAEIFSEMPRTAVAAG